MSYILEALRKSEQERRDQDQSTPFAPGVASPQSETRSGSNPWIWISLIVIISVNCLVVLFLFKDEWFGDQAHYSSSQLETEPSQENPKSIEREQRSTTSLRTEPVRTEPVRTESNSVQAQTSMLPTPSIPDRYASNPASAENRSKINESIGSQQEIGFSYSEADVIRPKSKTGIPEMSADSYATESGSSPNTPTAQSIIDNYQAYQTQQAEAKHELVNVSSKKQPYASVRDQLTEGLESPEVIKPNSQTSNHVTPQQNSEVSSQVESQTVAFTQRDADRLPKIRDLDRTQQQQVPAISFSGHLYSSRPTSRSVRFGNERYKEGDWVTSSLQLQSITEDGVVFSLEGMSFYMSSFEEWKGL